MVSYMDNVVDTLAGQVLRSKLDKLTHFVRHKLNLPFGAHKEDEPIQSLPREKQIVKSAKRIDLVSLTTYYIHDYS